MEAFIGLKTYNIGATHHGGTFVKLVGSAHKLTIFLKKSRQGDLLASMTVVRENPITASDIMAEASKGNLAGHLCHEVLEVQLQ